MAMIETPFHLRLARGKRRAAKILALALATVVAVGVLGAPGASARAGALAGPEEDAYFDADVTVDNPVFFPRVRDDFKDATVLNIGAVQYQDARATITDKDGNAIRSLVFGDAAPDRPEVSWQARWDGRDQAGRLAADGTYRALLTADVDTFVDGERVVVTVHATRTLRLASGVRNRAFTITRAAAKTSRRTSGEGCRTRKIDRDLALTCRKGTSASASWRVRLPSRATKVRWELVRDSASRRGGPGRRVETAVRKNRRLLVVTATVTRSRHQRYDAVVVRYHRRVRV